MGRGRRWRRRSNIHLQGDTLTPRFLRDLELLPVVKNLVTSTVLVEEAQNIIVSFLPLFRWRMERWFLC